MLKFSIFSLSEKYIKDNDLKEITSVKSFIRVGEPDPEGLFSYEIFGLPGSEERKTRFAYIRLNSLFVHPHVYTQLKFVKRKYVSLINGDEDFYIYKGDIVPVEGSKVPANAKIGTGVKFLYDNWDKLDFSYKKLDFGPRYNRLRFLKTIKRNDAFVNKILVIPPFYRDIAEGSTKNELNSYYSKMLNLASTISATKDLFGSFEASSDVQTKIQISMIEFYDQMVKMFGGRKGFAHRSVMGKNIDYSARMVISTDVYDNAERPGDMMTSYDKSKIPLSAVSKCFAPFMIFGIREIVEQLIHGNEFIHVKTKDGLKRATLSQDWRAILNSEYISTMIELYYESKDARLKPFVIETEEYGEVPLAYIEYGEGGAKILMDDSNLGGDNVIPMTWTHIFYMAAYDTVRDKHVMITRYPIEDHNSTYNSKMNIYPYVNMTTANILGTEYPMFPYITKDDINNPTVMFVDSLVIFTGYLGALGADFDGDMINIIGVFSDEANKDLHDYIWSPGNIGSISGESSIELGGLNSHVINALTFGKVK